MDIRRIAKRFLKDEAGAFAILFAFVFTLLIGVTGAALDFARGHFLKSELTSALDAAALAAGSAVSADNVEEIAQKYFDVNFPDGYLASTVSELDFSSTGEMVTISATATLDYSLLGLFVDGDISVSTETEVTIEKRGMELVMIMDNTGSMFTDDKIGTMKTAALGLIDIIYGDNEEVDDLWVGLVPYVASVNVGNQYTDWVTGLNQNNFFPTTWKGCVNARSNELSDDTPTAGGRWTTMFWPSDSGYQGAANRWRCSQFSSSSCPRVRSTAGSSQNIYTNSDCSGSYRCYVNENYQARYSSCGNFGCTVGPSGPNLSCASPITPLTKSKSAIQAGINEMQSWSNGGTVSDVGLAWGWRVISPKWKGLWDGVAPAQPFDYEEPLIDKVAILLTDGQNDVGNSISAYGRFTSTSAAVAQENRINDNIGTLCTAMKSEGVIIYTITFAISGSIQGIYEDCATSPSHYFDSPTNNQLDSVFEQIGDSLSNLRISR